MMMNPLKDNTERAKYAVILIWVSMAFDIITLVGDYMQFTLLKEIETGKDFAEATLRANDARQQLLAILSLIVLIISGITFIMWFRRAYDNLHQKCNNLSFSEGWAAGSWFVPFINLDRPLRIMRELYRETNRLFAKSDAAATNKLSTAALGWWWALFILSGILGQISFRIAQAGDSLGLLINSTQFSMAESIIGIPLALITVKVIRDYSKAEYTLSTIPGDYDNNENTESTFFQSNIPDIME